MKKLLAIMVAVALLATLAVPAFAKLDVTAEQQRQVPSYNSTEEQAQRQETNQEVENYIINKSKLRSGGKKVLATPLYMQETDYYCGPACAQMILKHVTGTKYSQSKLADSNHLHTDADGETLVYRVTETLNKYITSSKYSHVLIYDSIFGNDLVYSIDKNRPIACQVYASSLPGYGSNWGGHWIVATGYEWNMQGSSSYSTIYYNDPNYDSRYYGKHSCDVSEVENAMDDLNGYYVRAN